MRHEQPKLAVFAAVPVFLAALVGTAALAAAPRSVDYLGIEANEGTSAGGHAALRFDDRVYHFQYVDGGYVRIFREDSQSFLRHYATLGNRSIDRFRIEVSEDTYARLSERFEQLRLLQGRQFERLATARDDRLLLAALLERRRGSRSERNEGALLPLAGAGFFLPDASGLRDGAEPEADRHPAQRSPALVDLRRRVAAVRGRDYLARRIGEVRDSLLRLDLGDAECLPAEFSDRTPPVAAYPISRRYADRMLALLALEVLRGATPLRSGTFLAPGDEEFRLGEVEALRLRAYARSLADELVDLTASSRPDWGWALLVGMARLVVLEATLETGHWVLLDAFPAEARVVAADRRRAARGWLARARADFRDARAAFVAAPAADERSYAAVEAAANRMLEWRRGALEGRAVRVHPGPVVPSKPAMPSELVLPLGSESELASALAQATACERKLALRLRSLYAYNLFTKNCVSEIFRNIGVAFEGEGSRERPAKQPDGVVRAESYERLGGYIPPRGTLAFIPFAAARAVNGAYRVSERVEIPSHRKRRLAEMSDRDGPFAVFLRESNTLTSTIYERNAEDSFFVFFTDGAILPRPIFGAINLVAALGEGALGLVRLPADGGRTLWSGLRGAFVSLPELVFFNIRKGSYPYVDAPPSR